MKRALIKNKPLECEQCGQQDTELVYFKGQWVCPHCLNKTDPSTKPKIEDHVYSGWGPEW